MNLQEALNYRTTCLIHKTPLKPYCSKEWGEKLVLNQYGLHIVEPIRLPVHEQDIYAHTNEGGVCFHFDGTYTHNGKPPPWLDRGDYFIADMMCDKCSKVPITKSRGIGYSTLISIQYTQYVYSFLLKHDASKENGYKVSPLEEKVKYVRDEKFYHVEADLVSGRADFKMGSCKGTDSLDSMLKGMLSLPVPQFNMQRIRDIDHLVEKVKLYNLFS